VIILAGDAGSCTADTCVDYGFSEVTFQAAAGVNYFVLVDGYQDAEGSYTISVGCEATNPGETDCENGSDDDGDGLVDCEDGDCFYAGAGGVCEPPCKPAFVDYAKMTCPADDDSWNPESAGSHDRVERYACNNYTYDGPEYVYTYVAEDTGPVTVTVTDDTEDLDIIVLEDEGLGCNPASCVNWGFEDVTFEATAGTTYYLVVDGWLGAVADYDLVFSCGG